MGAAPEEPAPLDVVQRLGEGSEDQRDDTDRGDEPEQPQEEERVCEPAARISHGTSPVGSGDG